MYSYLLALGSNLGDRLSYLQQAIRLIEKSGAKLIAQSGVYETQPIGAADLAFFNAAIVVESPVKPEGFLEGLLNIEKDLGRERKTRWGNRTIDCDILLARTDLEYVTTNTEFLTIPHPAMLDRSFVLVPAAEVAGDWRMPADHQTLQNHLNAFGYVLKNRIYPSILPKE